MDRLVWIDCEMTGLDLRKDALIEVACLVTDSNLAVLDDGIDMVIKPPRLALEAMSDVVRAMHTESKLLKAVESGVTLAEAEERLLSYVTGHVPEPRKVPLCGNSIATDCAFLARDMPALDAHLHYRMVDVSSVKELVRRWYPRVYYASPEKKGGHRALADITESIAELRYYRAAVFVPEPGPDSATAKLIAEDVQRSAAGPARGGSEDSPTGPDQNGHPDLPNGASTEVSGNAPQDAQEDPAGVRVEGNREMNARETR